MNNNTDLVHLLEKQIERLENRLDCRIQRMESKIDSLVEFKTRIMTIVVVISAGLSILWNCALLVINKHFWR